MFLRRMIVTLTLALMLLAVSVVPAAAFNVLGCNGIRYGTFYTSEYAPMIPQALLDFECGKF